MVSFRCWAGYVLAISSLLSSGCTLLSIGGYGPDGQTRIDFENRVEAAFRLQNRMTSEVMMRPEADGYNQHQDTILQAEQLMQKNCRYLNEYASRDMDGLKTGLFLLRHVENSVVDCENAAHKLETLLNQP
jgi:hypothetical protein